MRPTLIISSIVAVISVASGCTPEPKKAERTVEQYLADKELMNRKIEECTNNPGDQRNDPDCINAGTAASLVGLGSLRDLPPVLGPAESSEKPGKPGAR